jgi:hypothetical protein
LLGAAEAIAFLPDVRPVAGIPSGAAYVVVFAADVILNAAALKVLRLPAVDTYLAAVGVAVGLGALAQFVGLHWRRANSNGDDRRWTALKFVSVAALSLAIAGMGIVRFEYASLPRPALPPINTNVLVLTSLAFGALQSALVAAGVALARIRATRDPLRAELTQQQVVVVRKLRSAFRRWKRSAGNIEAMRSHALEKIHAIRHNAVAVIYEGREGRSRRHPGAEWHSALQTPIAEQLFAPIPVALSRTIDSLPADQLSALRAFGLLAEDKESPHPNTVLELSPAERVDLLGRRAIS